MIDAPTVSIEMLRELEASLAEPAFRGMPIGPMLNSSMIIELFDKQGDWRLAARWKNRLRQLKYFLLSGGKADDAPPLPQHRVLIAWLYDNFRLNDMASPIVEAIGAEHCVVLGGFPNVVPLAPRGVVAVHCEQVMQFDAMAWRKDYLRCRREWRRRLRNWCEKYNLPGGVLDRFEFHMMVASRLAAGSQSFLRRTRPAAILTDYDRDAHWAPLVLAARLEGIPTLTLVHGVMSEKAVGFTPVLADEIFCWGEFQRQQLIEAGECRAKMIVAGCPRLTRELSLSSAAAKMKLGLPADKPAVMLGTAPISPQACVDTAEYFCNAMKDADGISAFVRLHPSEHLASYESAAKRFPSVRFLENSAASLDDMLAAADIVVVNVSGLGSDALVKRRLTIVLKVPNIILGHGQDLVDQAGCPLATDPQSLREAIQRLLVDGPQRRACEESRESFIRKLIAYFGNDAALQVAEAVRKAACIKNA